MVKLLAMTASNSDGEALAAIRQCNEMLARNKLRWDDIVQLTRPDQDNDRPCHPGHPGGESFRNYSRSSRFVFEESIRRQDYFRRTDRNVRVASFCAYVQNMPLLLRLLFFPLWAAAAMMAAVVIPATRRRERALATCCVAVAIVACTVVWLQLVSGVLAFLLAA